MGVNNARNVAQLHDLNLCIFGFEMIRKQLTYRLLSREAGITSSSNKRPLLVNLPKSGSIESNAELVIMIYKN